MLLRSDRSDGTKGEKSAEEDADGVSSLCADTARREAPHELLVAWVQFLKADIMEAVNALHNRLNVIAHTAKAADSDKLREEHRKALDRIRGEGERAAKITTGLLRRVNALAPDSVPPVVFEYDRSRLPPGRILLVENDEANRTVIRKVFERFGQSVTAVTNGYDAFAELEAREADCIVCDIRLPYLDGRTLYEQVEQQLPQLASRFVFVTGDYTNPDTLGFLKLTGQPYIGKPYELEALLGAVAAVLGNRTGNETDTETRDYSNS